MPCDQFQEALSDLACAAAEPRGDLRAHLDACAPCRIAFERERLLFASIDSGVRQLTNADVPASLLPAIRAHLAKPSQTRHGSGTASWIYAAAAAAAALFLLALPFFHPRTPAVETAAQPEIRQSPEQKIPALQAAATPSIVASRSAEPKRKLHSGGSSQFAQNHEPEVLVPAEEREALAKFVSAVVERQNLAAALIHPASSANPEGLAIDPLNIAQLEVKSLEEKALDGSARRD